ncbi:TBC1 domain family member 1 [Trichonephila inaurata madagascariensis]|uniref:TBC1 domain family member 1 n=1 Tax=Trichonephila inaurata madagascariensis TaxID=2747483 RepID=A0A8X6X5G2_9ARAC|nr:TBC1 domain family member 1 [Trichonephila inaurata madagascariensis]
MPKVEYSRLQDSDVELSSKYQRTFIARYYGRALVERWHTQPMLPWIIAEIQRLGSPKSETVFLTITECSIKAVNVKFGRVVFEHKLGSVTKFNQLADSPRCFAYLTKEGSDVSLCHAFQASDELAVFQLFTVLKEAIQESSIGIKAKEDSPFDAVQSKQCQQYEVLYVGKIKVSQKRGPQRFVDDAIQQLINARSSPVAENSSILKKLDSKLSDEIISTAKKPSSQDWAFNVTSDVVQHPLLIQDTDNGNPQKPSCRQRLLSDNQGQHSLAPPSQASLITHSQSLDTSSRDALVHDIQTLAFTSEQFSSVIEDGSLHRQTSLPPMNAKTFLECSLGFPLMQEESSNSLSDDQNHDNRTMLFLVSPCDIRLISTDKKELLFQKDFSSISHCSQGEEYPDHFGLICPNPNNWDGLCWIHFQFNGKKTVLDTEGETPEQVQSIVMMHIAALAEKEQKELMSKYQEIIVRSLAEQNIVFMTLLRALCEQKQMKHTHTVSKEHKEKRALSPLSNLTSMAKKTFPNTFDTVFKDAPLTKAHSLPIGARSDYKFVGDKKGSVKDQQKAAKVAKTASISAKIQPPIDESSVEKKDLMRQVTPPKEGTLITTLTTDKKRKESASLRNATERSLSDTAAVLWDLRQGEHQVPSQNKENMTTSDVKINELPRTPLKASPLRNIFLRVGSKKGNFPLKEIKEQHGSKGSWRKMLFNRVQRPFAKDIIFGEIAEEKRMEPPKHSSSHLKALWKKAIMEQIILIRLEREQKKLKMKQDRILEKHTKLDYDVICPSPNDSIQKWDVILNSNPDYDALESTVKYGVPRQKRGEIWLFLANKYCVANKSPPVDNTPYVELLRKLTPYQHAILIDIGRTYPGHPYFKQVLGPGQLSLFSLLKAYSVVDEEVGYCQGLSFLGGILLLHLDEEKSFHAMKHIMFTLGLRNQYKSDMGALQVQMYQLARIVQNTVPEVHELFDKYEVSPMLYAAPWFLTFFASHFPIGFVARLLDMLFLQGIKFLFKYLLAFKGGHVGMEKVLDQVLSMDVEKSLLTYQIEYMVLKEEMSELNNDSETTSSMRAQVENENKDLQKQNMELTEQLQVALNTVSRLEASVTSYQSTIRKLESHVRTLQDERDAMHHSVNILRKRLDSLDLGSPPSEPELANQLDVKNVKK